MSYRHILVRRWSRRDRLAVMMVALTVAFLTGSTLLILTASAQPIGIADQFSSPGTATVLDADDAPDDALTGGSDLGQAIEAAIGNISLLLGALGSLAAVMTVGGLSASMAQAVHARRRTIGIHRAVGASPRGILQLVMRDALVIGALGTIGAFIISLLVLQFLDVIGLMTVYGIRIPTLPTPEMALIALVTGLGLTLCSAAVAVGSLLRGPPAALLTGEARTPAGGKSHEN